MIEEDWLGHMFMFTISPRGDKRMAEGKGGYIRDHKSSFILRWGSQFWLWRSGCNIKKEVYKKFCVGRVSSHEDNIGVSEQEVQIT